MKIFENKGKILKLAMIFFILLVAPAHAQGIKKLGIVSKIPSAGRILPNYVPGDVIKGLAKRMSHIAPTKTLDLRIMLQSKDLAGLQKFVQDLYNPKSPNYHKFLTPEQFDLLYGASSTDSSVVINYLTNKGFKVNGQSKSGLILKVTAPVSAVEPIFKLAINNYKRTSDGTAFFAPEVNPTVDPILGDKVTAIFGLDNTARIQSHFHRKALSLTIMPKSMALGNSLAPHKTIAPAFSGFNDTIVPSDIYKAYNLNSILSTGGGQNLALYEMDGYALSDIQMYETTFGLPSLTPTNICVEGTGTCPSPGSGTDEVVLDIDIALAVAPGLSSILVYEVPSPSSIYWLDEWDRIASDDTAKVISCSWGFTDETESPDDQAIFLQLASQGQTVMVAAGDTGGQVSDPATQPNITSVGISALTINGNGSYNSETGSADGAGGVSTFFTVPSWQTTAANTYFADKGPGFGSTTKRNIPDVSFTSDPSTLYYIYVSGSWGGYWGSSIAAPIWAAFIARVNQGRIALGGADNIIGFLNPVIYQIAQSTNYTTDFHDITVTGGNPSPADTGYDDATGLGSFNGANLFTDLVGLAAPAGFTATPGNNQVLLSWSSVTGAASYNVNRSTSSGGESFLANVATAGYLDTTASNGTTYYYEVDAVDGGSVDGASSSEVSTMPQATLAPIGLTAVAGNATVALSWTAVGTAVSYNVKRSTTSGAEVLLINVGTNSYTDNAVVNGQAYYYVVSAIDGSSMESSNSSEVSVIPGTPVPPTAVTAVRGDTQATISFTPGADNGSAITSYTATSSPGGRTGSCTVGTTCVVSGGSVSLTVNGLTNGTVYTFTVTATNANGTSSSSDLSNVITPAGDPFAPTAVTATAGNAQATVSFTAGSDNGSPITTFTATSSPGNLTATGASSPITVSGLTNNTSYTFTVTATNSVGTGPASSASNTVTPSSIAPPTGLKVTLLAGRIAGRTIVLGTYLTWAQSTAPGIRTNTIYRSIGAGAYSAVATVAATTSFKDSNLTKGTTYHYKISAHDPSYESAPSDPVSINY